MDLEHYKTILLNEKGRLERELSSIATPNPALPGDWNPKFPEKEKGSDYSSSALEEQSDVNEEFEATIAEEYTLESRLQEVLAALKRIEEKTYGVCRECGTSIPEERLEANSAAAYDIEHQPKE